MSRVCEVTGRRVRIGNNVSHSKRRTKRTFSPNLRSKRFWDETRGEWVRLKVSAAGMRDIEKNGLQATLERAEAKGYYKKRR